MNCPLCDRPMSSYWPSWSLCFSCGLVAPDEHEAVPALAVSSPDATERAAEAVAA